MADRGRARQWQATQDIESRRLTRWLMTLAQTRGGRLSTEGERVSIRGGRSRFTLSSLPATDFPVIEEINAQQTLTLAQGEFRRLVDKTQGFGCHGDDIAAAASHYSCRAGVSGVRRSGPLRLGRGLHSNRPRPLGRSGVDFYAQPEQPEACIPLGNHSGPARLRFQCCPLKDRHHHSAQEPCERGFGVVGSRASSRVPTRQAPRATACLAAVDNG
jgi:hypothetical protein